MKPFGVNKNSDFLKLLDTYIFFAFDYFALQGLLDNTVLLQDIEIYVFEKMQITNLNGKNYITLKAKRNRPGHYYNHDMFVEIKKNLKEELLKKLNPDDDFVLLVDFGKNMLAAFTLAVCIKRVDEKKKKKSRYAKLLIYDFAKKE